jgi:hypothetical protein
LALRFFSGIFNNKLIKVSAQLAVISLAATGLKRLDRLTFGAGLAGRAAMTA